jgi:ATP-dependent Lon protease
MAIKTTKGIKIPTSLVDQVIGQEEAVNIIKKAALQRRHVLLIGEPGTGKSMLGLALSDLLPKSEMKDIICYQNPEDENEPLIRTIDAGKGREEVKKSQLDSKQLFKNMRFLYFIVAIVVMIAPWWARSYYKSDIMFAAFFMGGMMFLAALSVMLNVGPKAFGGVKTIPPKLIVDNFGKKKATFFDATGAHAGALLGDVLHDPLQSFIPNQWLNLNDKKSTIQEIVDTSLLKHQKNLVTSKKENYEAAYTDKNELITLGEVNEKIKQVEILSSNRYDYNGEMIKITTSKNKELIVTPQHKVAINNNGKTKYIAAKGIKVGDQVISKAEDVIITAQDIINTYSKRQQEQCRLYYQYKEIKAAHPLWGYKRIAKTMGQPIGKTRWWHAQKHIPTPIQRAQSLKKQGLLPLTADHPQLPLIAKIIGSSFGDGGIFQNLNAIFLSSKEKSNVKEFGQDIKEIFQIQESNTRIIRGGVHLTSYCYQNTNRNLIRFFVALGAPVGKKTKIKLKIPKWIYKSKELQTEFFSSLLGSEVGIPKVHVSKKHLNSFSFAITGEPEVHKNRLIFFQELKNYFNSISVKTGKIITKVHKTKLSSKHNYLYQLHISTTFENLINFSKNGKLNYCEYKRKKLTNTINQFSAIKKERYQTLINQGYGAEHTMKLLQLTPKALYEILNETEFLIKESEASYT